MDCGDAVQAFSQDRDTLPWGAWDCVKLMGSASRIKIRLFKKLPDWC